MSWNGGILTKLLSCDCKYQFVDENKMAHDFAPSGTFPSCWALILCCLGTSQLWWGCQLCPRSYGGPGMRCLGLELSGCQETCPLQTWRELLPLAWSLAPLGLLPDWDQSCLSWRLSTVAVAAEEELLLLLLRIRPKLAERSLGQIKV